MKIHKALKVKNRLAGEVANLQEVFKRENSRRSDNPSEVQRSELKEKLDAKRAELFKIKGAISQATAPITPKLAELEEAKAEKNFLAGVPCREGKEVIPMGGATPPLTLLWTAYLNRAALDTELETVQHRINALQDEVDEFNARTDVIL